jgi:hypothetical protein
VEYLFLPKEMLAALDELPNLRALLGSLDEEGVQSAAFPLMRKCERQIVRVVSNDHYAHLKTLIESLDYCVEKGFIPAHLVRTRHRTQFDSLLAEARVAERFFRKGFAIEGLEDIKQNQSVPEFVASRNGTLIAVEVYSPRTAEGLDLFIDELLDMFKNLDRPLDFEYEIRVDQLHRFDESQRLLFLHPQVLGEGLTGAIRDRTAKTLLDEILSQLDSEQAACSSAVELEGLNLDVKVSIGNVRSSPGDSPARRGVIHHPPLSGYAPEAMLSALVKGRLSRKIRRGQAPRSGLAASSLLVVDLTHAGELARECELDPDGVRETLQKELPDDLGGYDVVAVTTATVADGGGRLLFLAAHDQDGPVASVVRELYE